ncbi:MAG: acetate/propionate family kinase [Alphaproteobacteria bacterium]|nr:acetate/propionate family kinase [Alphaproteobacteria bacterium]
MSSEAYVLVINCGSSSLKFALYNRGDRACVGQGSITGIGTSPILSARGEKFTDTDHAPLALQGECRTTTEATEQLIQYLQTILPPKSLEAVGHRVVHGGEMSEHCLLTPAMLMYLKSLFSLAPLHQPYNMAAVDQIGLSHPEIPQVACLDTAFHATIPMTHRRFAIPRIWHDKGLRRYGFHGLSYEYIAAKLKTISPRAYSGNTIVAHLGNGASLCGIKAGKSYDTTMSFTALDGLVMGTRTGLLDPGIILYWMKEAKLDADAIEKLLYKQSGLLGVSGISSDMEPLLKSTETSAKEAVDLFCHRVRQESGALCSTMGGLDAFVFTGGMGENAPVIREKIAEGMKWAGMIIDPEKNAAAKGHSEQLISTPDSKVEVWRIPTNEESVIVNHTCKLAFGE